MIDEARRQPPRRPCHEQDQNMPHIAGTEIDARAAICPACRSKQPAFSRPVGLLLLFGFIAIVATWMAGEKKTTPPPSRMHNNASQMPGRPCRSGLSLTTFSTTKRGSTIRPFAVYSMSGRLNTMLLGPTGSGKCRGFIAGVANVSQPCGMLGKGVITGLANAFTAGRASGP